MYSHRGNGKLGLLCLISQGEVFNTFSDVEFVPPVNLGQHPVIPEGCTGLEAASAKKEHEDKFKEFQIYDQTYKALNNYKLLQYMRNESKVCVISMWDIPKLQHSLF